MNGKDTIAVVEGMGYALKLSGATAQEASSVMLQFSQAMNSGRLNGAEFNAVAEGAPIILRAIEAELRATGRGAELAEKGLKKMGSEGSIGAKLMANAIIKARDQMEQDFNSLPLTVDGAVQRIKNAWLKTIGELNQDSNFTGKMAESLKKFEELLPVIAKTVVNTISFLVNNFEMLIKTIATLGTVVAALKFGSMITNMLMLSTGATTASAALSITATSIATAATASLSFSGVIATLGNTIKAVFLSNPAGIALLAIAAAAYAAHAAITSLTKANDELKASIADVAAKSKIGIDAMNADVVAAMKAVDDYAIAHGQKAKYAKELSEFAKREKEDKTKLKESAETLATAYRNEDAARRTVTTLSAPTDFSNAIKGIVTYTAKKTALADAENTLKDAVAARILAEQRSTKSNTASVAVQEAAAVKEKIVQEDAEKQRLKATMELNKKFQYDKRALMLQEISDMETKAKLDGVSADVIKKTRAVIIESYKDKSQVKEINKLAEALDHAKKSYAAMQAQAVLTNVDPLEKLTEAQKKLIELQRESEKSGHSKAGMQKLNEAILIQKQTVELEKGIKAKRDAAETSLKFTENLDKETGAIQQQILKLQQLSNGTESSKVAALEASIISAENELTKVRDIALTQEQIEKQKAYIAFLKQAKGLQEGLDNKSAYDDQLKK